MCDRQEKGVVSDHQRALQKMGQYKKKKMSATIQGPSEAAMVEQLEQRILQVGKVMGTLFGFLVQNLYKAAVVEHLE